MKAAGSMRKTTKAESSTSSWDMRKRYENVTVKCEFCGEAFNTSKAYQDHARQEHPDQVKATWIPCKQCSMMLPSRLAMVSHKAKIHSKADIRDSSGRLACEYCARTYKNMLDMNKHCLKDHYEILKRDWIPCPACHLYFRNQQGLVAHTHQKHPKDESKGEVQCSFCPKIFTGLDPFHQHANRYHLAEIEKEWFFDPEQKLYFPKQQEKKKKQRASKDGFQCSFCPKTFTTIDPLYQHANRYHLEDIEKEWFYNPLQKMYYPKPPDLNKKQNQGPVIWCEFCSATVHYSYVPHANKHHFDIISKIWPGCDDCNMFFPTIQSLDSHNLAKHKMSTSSFRNRKLTPGRKVTTCVFCEKSFVIARLCWRHAQREHADVISQLWLKCKVCELHFPNSEVLSIHVKAKHNKKKGEEKESSPKCEFCPSSFSSIHICTRHANANHLDLIKDKWKKCHVCGYYLQTESALALHKGKHDETCSKKILCDFCPSRFHYFKTYALHANRAHADNMEGSWRLCDKCNLYFPPNGHKHFKESEAPTEIGCKFCTETFKLSKDHIQHCNKLHVEEISTKWFHCDLCLEYYPTVKGLKRHQKSFCKSVSEKSVRKRNSSRIKSEEMDEDGDEASSTPPRKRPPRRASARRKNYNLDDDFGDQMDINFAYDEDWVPVVKIEEGTLSVQAGIFEDSQTLGFRIKEEPAYAGYDDEDEEESLPLSVLRSKKSKKMKSRKTTIKLEDNDVNNDQNYVDNNQDDSWKNMESQNTISHDDGEEEDDNYDTLDIIPNNFVGDDDDDDELLLDKEEEETFDDSNHQNEESKSESAFVEDGKQFETVENEKLLKWPFDMDKVNIEPEDFDDYKTKKSAGSPSNPHQESFGKRCTYKVPKTSTNVKLVTTIDRNGAETKRVQCEYCPKTHINVPVYNLHVNTEHLELAMLYWLPCESCTKYFPSEFTLMKHKRISHPSATRKPRLLCDFCSTTHCDSSSLYRHVNKKHLDCVGKSWVDCKVCGYYLPTATSLASHVLNLHPKYHKKVQASMEPMQPKRYLECSCDFCDSQYYSRDGLRDHLKTRHAEEIAKRNDVPTQCAFCSTTLDSTELYYEHANGAHPEEVKKENWVTCHNCKMLVPTECTYIIHRKFCMSTSQNEATNVASVQCEFCPQNFSKRGSYYFHANSVHKELILAASWPYCQACDKHVSPQRFELHQTCCRGKANPNSSKSKEDYDDEDDLPIRKVRRAKKEIECPYCPMTFLHNHNFQFHVNQRHREKLVEANWVPCTNCPKLFSTAARLQIHLKACLQNKEPAKKNTKIYPQKSNIKCSFCSNVFINGGKYYAHANKCHADAISFWLACPECGVRFPTKRAVRMHLVRCRGQQQQEVKKRVLPRMYCQFCDMSGTSTRDVVKHANSRHLAEVKAQWLLCPGCQKFFPDSLTLERHSVYCSEQNKNEKEFFCEFCSEKFSKLMLYTRHANEEHEQEAIDNAWKFCNKCKNYIPKMWNLKTHSEACKNVKRK